jgi:uncharacterized protein
MKALHIVAFILLVIGGLNWLLVAFDWNLVEAIFGTSIFTKIIYVLVGLSAVYLAFAHKSACKTCCATPSVPQM